jgi:hypothetical protein
MKILLVILMRPNLVIHSKNICDSVPKHIKYEMTLKLVVE